MKMVKCKRKQCGKELGKVHRWRKYCRKCANIVAKKKMKEYMKRYWESPKGKEHAENYQKKWREENKDWMRDWRKERHKKNQEKQAFLKKLPPDELLKHVRGLL